MLSVSLAGGGPDTRQIADKARQNRGGVGSNLHCGTESRELKWAKNEELPEMCKEFRQF